MQTNPKIAVIITKRGVQSVTVQALSAESRKAGYETCSAIEPVFKDINRIVRGLYKDSKGSDIKNKTKSTQVM